MNRPAIGEATALRVRLVGDRNASYARPPGEDEVAAIVAALDAFAAQDEAPIADDVPPPDRWRIAGRRAAVDRWARGPVHRRWTGSYE